LGRYAQGWVWKGGSGLGEVGGEVWRRSCGGGGIGGLGVGEAGWGGVGRIDVL